VVINCAAYTDVDGAEVDESAATAVNGEGVGALAERCREVGALLVHYSTDYVFDGEGTAPYATDHPTRPVNAYGRGKLAGEVALRQAGGEHLLIRTSWLYAPWGKNFVLTIAGLAAERPELRVVDDQRGRPTSAVQLAALSAKLIRARARGTFHVCDGGECTWFDLATEVARLVSPACTVQPCTSAEFPRPAKRPAYSVLDCSAAEAITGPPREWRPMVQETLARRA
jgi:dTDP-4-dehydrorhamnose reductase